MRYVSTAIDPLSGDTVTFDMVMGPAPVQYINACSGFCTNGLINSALQCVPGGDGDGGQANFDRCISQTQPVNCQGVAMPIAAVGSQLYYAHSATNAQCQVQAACIPT